jgi:hypothetical protein
VSRALRFAGAQSVTVLDNPSLRPSDVTLEAWVNFGVQTDPHPAIIAKPFGTGTADSYVMWYQASSLWGTTGQIAIAASWQPVLGRWYHLAYTYDHVAKKQALYVDGTRMAIGDADATAIMYDDHSVLIGDDLNSESGQFSFFVGDIDEVRIWGTARSALEIAGARAICLPADAPGLLGYWQFEEESSQLVNDSSIRGNAGYLGSSPNVDGADPTRVGP